MAFHMYTSRTDVIAFIYTGRVSVNTIAFLCVSCGIGRLCYFFIVRGHNILNIRATAV